ncbi:hypothetical protein [Granulicoccus sp. GXG6511]|uniref:hypothetical protein n=1 Tax=Granulicoccus sp. GXG6511 TaxID=3381351 RepID=UPI003D7C3C03
MRTPEPSPHRDFGRDGVSGLVSPGRALRAREVSRPTAEDLLEAERAADGMLARLDQQRQRRRRR